MHGNYNNTILRIFESLSQFFADLSCKATEVFDEIGSRSNRALVAVYTIFGAAIMLIYGVLGLIIGLFRLVGAVIIGNSQTTLNQGIYIQRRDLVVVCSICVAVFFSVYWLSRIEWAKETNLHYINNRYDINSICRYDMPIVNSSDNYSWIYHLRNVTESENTSREAQYIRNQVGDTLPKDLHFATVSDYLVTLLAFEQYETLSKCAKLDYFKESKNRGNAELFHHHLEKQCKEYFELGLFYKSDKCLDLIFEFSKGESIKAGRAHYNNSFYLMRLFNEDIDDRYLSSHSIHAELAKIVNDVDNIKYMQPESISRSLSRRDNDIWEYLLSVKQLYLAYDEQCEFPTDRFLQIYNKTNSEILKQYSLYMALRSYGEPMGLLIRCEKVGDKQASDIIAKWEYIERICKNVVTYPYLLNTMYIYTMQSQL